MNNRHPYTPHTALAEQKEGLCAYANWLSDQPEPEIKWRGHIDEHTGSKLLYYVRTPQEDARAAIEPFFPPDDESSLIVMAHPYGSGRDPHMVMRAQAVADITGNRVLGFPNNAYGQRKNEQLSSTSKILCGKIGIDAFALNRLGAIHEEAVEGEPIHFTGWSEAGAFAVVQAAVSLTHKELFEEFLDKPSPYPDLNVASVSAFDAPNVLKRSITRIYRDLLVQGGEESSAQAARRVGSTALSSAMQLDSRWRRALEELKYAAWAATSSVKNKTRIDAFRGDSLATGIATVLQHSDAVIHVASGEHSRISPAAANIEIFSQLQLDEMRGLLTILEKAGHGLGHNIVDLAGLVTMSLTMARRRRLALDPAA